MFWNRIQAISSVVSGPLSVFSSNLHFENQEFEGWWLVAWMWILIYSSIRVSWTNNIWEPSPVTKLVHMYRIVLVAMLKCPQVPSRQNLERQARVHHEKLIPTLRIHFLGHSCEHFTKFWIRLHILQIRRVIYYTKWKRYGSILSL